MATVGAFRVMFPEFSLASFPTERIEPWLNLALSTLPADRWGSFLDLGAYLFTAHNVTLGAQEAAASERGGAIGQVKGPLSAQAVDKVSASYDTGSVALEGGGDWNLTKYGVRFLRLARMMGAGGIQL